MSSPTPPAGSPHEPTWHSEQSPERDMWGAPPPERPTRPRRRRGCMWSLLIAGVVAVMLIVAGLTALQGGLRPLAPAPTAGSGGLPEAAQAPAAPVRQADASAPDWSATAAAVSPSVVSISVEAGNSGGEGSGVIYDGEGHVLTNHHVVAAGGSGGSILVTLADKRVFEAQIVGTDAATDLAVLSLQGAPQDLRPITPGDDRELKVGQPVMAIGNPLGLSGTVTTGIVSALNRPVSTTQDAPQGQNNPFGAPVQGELVVTNAIQTSAAINPGNSGGALVDVSGQLVGINSSIASLSAQSGNIGIGFAIPITEARSVAGQLIRNGEVAHPYLGVQLQNAIATEGDIRRRAAGVARVESGTPAASAGLRSGDAIIAVDGVPVDSALSLTAQVRAREVGAETTITVVRDGQRHDIGVTLARRS
ncbi:MAG: trypsin-like peptidase domain-containing protein [Mobilicoccus sp.]|nr:trypsin-like peptidase domain-containing protein [Mobilicoccus sp.]